MFEDWETTDIPPKFAAPKGCAWVLKEGRYLLFDGQYVYCQGYR
jgi:hypothetical protein